MKLIISILLFSVSTVSFASGANHKYFFTKSDTENLRAVSSNNTIKPMRLNGDISKLKKDICFNKAIEKFMNYARQNPAYYANLSTLRAENKGMVSGAIKAIYSMEFLISDRTVTMDVPVSTIDGMCF